MSLLCLPSEVVAKEGKTIKSLFKKSSSKKSTKDSITEVIDHTKRAIFKIDNRANRNILIVNAKDISGPYWYINIVDVTGRMIARSTIPNAQKAAYFDTHVLQNNIYIVKVFDSSNISSTAIYFIK